MKNPVTAEKMKIISKTFYSANILKVSVGHIYPCGGDSGHGGRTLLRLEDEGGTDMWCRYEDEPKRRLEIRLGGDTEHDTFIEALEFAIAVLKGEFDVEVTEEETP